ncbi:MAG: glycosyltransferase [Alphaproteobacteria bacterium]|nr:glycosyltransferase [Alphaproteobacteria bacterium]
MGPPRCLLVSSATAPLGSGAAGGLTHSVRVLSTALHGLGARVDVLAPQGSGTGFAGRLLEVGGTLQPSLGGVSSTGAEAWPVPPGSALAEMWRRVLVEARRYELVLNLQHDWLGYFLAGALGPRLFHLPNLIGVNAATDLEIARLVRTAPRQIAFVSRAQAEAYGAGPEARVLHLSIDLADYPLAPEPAAEPYLAWAGRVSPVKGLALAAAGAAAAGLPLKVAGPVEDPAHLAELEARFPGTIEPLGFLPRPALARMLGGARGFLSTQSWQEALGLVTLEAMACGTPVIATPRGANRELIRTGETGFLLEEETPDAVAAAVARLGEIDRAAPRAFVAETFSPECLQRDLLSWLPLPRRGATRSK